MLKICNTFSKTTKNVFVFSKFKFRNAAASGSIRYNSSIPSEPPKEAQTKSIVDEYLKKFDAEIVSKNFPGQVDKFGNKCLYFSNQAFTIRAMLSVTVVNSLYWCSQCIHGFINKGVVVHGIDLSVEPYWAVIGGTITVALGFMTQQYAHGAVMQAYESADGKRVGFQMHNVLGNPGRKIELSLGNARLIYPKEKYFDPEVFKKTSDDSALSKMLPASKQIPVAIEGWRTNILLDKAGTYFENFRIMDLLTASKAQEEVVNNGKEERINYYHQNKTKSKNRKHNRYDKKSESSEAVKEEEKEGVSKAA